MRLGDLLNEHIVKVKDGYRLVSKKTGRNLGTYLTHAGAEKRERQVQYFKHASESKLNEFAPSDSGDDGEDDALRNYARMWWAGDEATQMQIEKVLARMGWEIGEDEGGYDNGGVFVVRAGDENGNSYQSWAAEDLTEDGALNNYRSRIGTQGNIQRQNQRQQDWLDAHHQSSLDRMTNHRDAMNRLSNAGVDDTIARQEIRRERMRKDDDDWDKTFDVMRDRLNRYQWSSQKDNAEQGVAEGGMPSSVIKSKQRYGDMSDKDFAELHQSKADDDLVAMAWRHGYGKGSLHYVNKRKRGKEGVAEGGRGRPVSGAWDPTSGTVGRTEKTATGIRHHADPSRYGGTEPDTDDDHLLSKAQIYRLEKATEPEVDEAKEEKFDISGLDPVTKKLLISIRSKYPWAKTDLEALLTYIKDEDTSLEKDIHGLEVQDDEHDIEIDTLDSEVDQEQELISKVKNTEDLQAARLADLEKKVTAISNRVFGKV